MAYWRRGRGKGRQKDGKNNARWHGRATILGEENGHYWLSHAGTLIRAAPEHLRHATREEEWAEREREYRELRAGLMKQQAEVSATILDLQAASSRQL